MQIENEIKKKKKCRHLQNGGHFVPAWTCANYLIMNFNVLQSHLVWAYA